MLAIAVESDGLSLKWGLSWKRRNTQRLPLLARALQSVVAYVAYLPAGDYRYVGAPSHPQWCLAS